MANDSLNKAKKAKNDEFYTLYSDVAKELAHYQQHFKGKIVYCNCDNPEWSAFWRYFHINFSAMGLKKLIATYKGNPTYKMEYTGGIDIDVTVGLRTPLKGDGDFRSQECLDILKESDIIVTNPPFSIAREYYIPMLYKYNKKFLIVGDLNWVKYKYVFPLFQSNQIWFGINNIKAFLQPNGTMEKFGNKLWYTNLDHNNCNAKIDCHRKYNESEYIKYDNYDAIECCPSNTIPVDYDGIMGVPISYLINHNPDQFEIVGLSRAWSTKTNKTYNTNQIQHTWDKSSKSFKKPIKASALNSGSPVIHLDKPYTDATYYEVDGQFYARTYERVFIRRR